MFTKLKNFDSTEKIDNWLNFRGFLVALILIFAIEISFYGTFFLQKFDSFSFLICAICLYLFYLWDKREKLKDNKFYLIRSKDDKKSVETVRINCYLDSTKDEDFLEFYTRVEFIKRLDIDGRLAMKKRLEEKIQADSSLEGVKVIYGFSNFDKITYHATILVNRENYEAMSKKLNSLTWNTIDEMINDKVDSYPRITPRYKGE